MQLCAGHAYQWTVRSQEVDTTIMSAMSTGRPKGSPVWEYLDLD